MAKDPCSDSTVRNFIKKLARPKFPGYLERDAGHGWITILEDLPLMADWYDKHLLEENDRMDEDREVNA